MYKKRKLAVMISILVGSTSVFAQTDMTSVESRLSALESRLKDAENRAESAEKKFSCLRFNSRKRKPLPSR